MRLFGKEMTKTEIFDRIGDLSQLGGIKSYELNDGPARGIRAFDFKTSAGLDMTVLADRGFEISYLSYKSIPISWRSATRETHPAYFESKWDEWLRNFYGGLFSMCGLTYCGFPSMDEGKEYNIHGRASNLPGYHICHDVEWEGDQAKLWLSGKIREVKFSDYKIELTRKITTFMDEPKIIIEDKIKNFGIKKAPLMLLYHFNIGWPVLDESSVLIEDEAKVTTRDEHSQKEIADFHKFCAPTLGFKDQIFLHDIRPDQAGFSNVALVNERFHDGEGIGVLIRCKKDTLPWLTQWKMLNKGGDYVCGIEPGNLSLTSYEEAKRLGTLQYLEAGEEKDFKIEVIVLRDNREIEQFKNKIGI
jgi:hypothetical protein